MSSKDLRGLGATVNKVRSVSTFEKFFNFISLSRNCNIVSQSILEH